MRKLDLKIAVAQLNPVVGDLVGNVDKIREAFLDADARGVDLVVTPELSVTGSPLGDLVNQPDLTTAAAAALDVLRNATIGRRAALLVGAPVRDDAGVHNAAAVFHAGGLLKPIRGKRLAGGGVSTEMRALAAERETARPFTLGGRRVGVLLGGDAWDAAAAGELRDNGAEILVSIDASPFRPDVLRARVEDVAARRVAETGLPLLFVNAVGGQDELVFDGGSFLMDAAGRRVLQLPQWEECVMDWDPASPGPVPDADFPDPLESVWRAMMLGLADYAHKSGFTDVMLGLSGGMDSALVASVAGDALGPGHVHCVRLPSRYTADISNSTAEEMCRAWGFSMDTLPIEKVVAAAAETLAPMAPDGLKQLTRENMQARARGYLLMTVSNDRGWMLLSTGNKSEGGVGYATLYGDMCGGFNPIKDVYKTTVFDLARWRNRNRPAGLLGPSGVAIPEAIIDRPPSAELAPGQRDTDSLPPYPVLDAILGELVEKATPAEDIVRQGFDRPTVDRVHRMLKNAEYKRRQGAPGPRISPRAFAGGRRLPIVNGFAPAMIDILRKMAEETGDN